MAHTQGKDIIILVDGEAVAACKSNDFSFSADTIEVASSTANNKEFIPSRKSWKATSSHLVARVKDMEALTGKTVDVVIRGRNYIEGPTLYRDEMTGKAIVTDCQVSAQNGSLCSGSVSLQGTGSLTHTTDYDYCFKLKISSAEGAVGDLPYTLLPNDGHVFDKSLFLIDQETGLYQVFIELIKTDSPGASSAELKLSENNKGTLVKQSNNNYIYNSRPRTNSLEIDISTGVGKVHLEYNIGLW